LEGLLTRASIECGAVFVGGTGTVVVPSREEASMIRVAKRSQNNRFFGYITDQIHRFETDWLSREPIAFVCECAELSCRALVFLTVAEFRAAREMDGRRFIAAPDHVDYEHERVSLATDRFVVVAETEIPVVTSPRQ
jgi:hypothetical protein